MRLAGLQLRPNFAIPATPGPSYDVEQMWVKYSEDEYPYITSASRIDMTSVRVGAKEVRVQTFSPDDALFCTSAMPTQMSDPDDERLLWRRSDGVLFVATDDGATWVPQASTISPPIGHAFEQGCCIDQTTKYIHSINAAGTVKIFDITGYLSGNVTATLVETITAPAVTGSVHWDYDYKAGRYFVAQQGQPVKIQVWVRSGNAIVLSETLWYSSRGGVARDYVNDAIQCADGSGINLRYRGQSVRGWDNLKTLEIPFPSGYTVEGIGISAIGTLFACEPSGHDVGQFPGPIPGGNGCHEDDVYGNRGKYDFVPSMTRFDRCSGGTLGGQFWTQVRTGFVGDEIYGPVYDMLNCTPAQSASNWGARISPGGTYSQMFRNSNTAPTGASKTHRYSTRPSYAGWGNTSPSAKQSTPGTNRYIQQVLTLATA